jgi:hypothetical protein
MRYVSIEGVEIAILINIEYIVSIEQEFISFDEDTGIQLANSIMYLSNGQQIYIKGASPYTIAHAIKAGLTGTDDILEILDYEIEIINKI